MKIVVAIPVIAAAVVLAGCKSKEPKSAFVTEDSRALHEAMIHNYWAEQTESAVQRAAAIYPYHFHLNSAELNELGSYEVGILATGADGRPLNVHLARGGATDELYQARINAVREALVDGGAAANMIAFDDQLPGGEGMYSDRVRFNAAREAEQLKAVYGAPVTGNGSTN